MKFFCPNSKQYSLRTLLLAIAALAFVLGGLRLFGITLTEAKRSAAITGQRNIMESLGGTLVVDPRFHPPATEIDLSAWDLNEQWLVTHLKYWEYRNIRVVRLRKCPESQDARARLNEQFPRVEFVLVSVDGN